jgi:hypothetical protein
MSDYRELLIGCGHRRAKDIQTPAGAEFLNLTTLDYYEAAQPDVLYDLDKMARLAGRLPFESNSFNEIHAYDVLEHIGGQGDYINFFHEFGEYWRVLRPNGFFCATIPKTGSDHVWGDPGHRREINALSLVYLSPVEVKKQLGKTTITDYLRFLGDTNFECIHLQNGNDRMGFVLKAIK